MADNQITITVGAVLTDLQSSFEKAKGWITSFVDTSTSSFKTVGTAAEEHAKKVKESFDKINESIKKVLETLLIYEGFKLGKELVFGGVEFADELYRLNVITGISVQELQRLKFAADATGTSFEMIQQMVQYAGKALVQLRSGAGGALRIAMADLGKQGLKESDLGDTQHVIEKVADAISKVHNASQRLGDMRGIFGRMGAEALPMLLSLRELEEEFNKLGFAVDDVGVAKAWAAGEAWNKLGSIWQFVKLQLSGDLAPAIKLIADLLVEAAGALDKWLKTPEAAEFGKKIAIGAINLAESIEQQLVPALKDLKAFFDAVKSSGEVLKGVLDFLFVDVTKGTAEIEKGLSGGVVNLKSSASGLTGGSWVDKTTGIATFGKVVDESKVKVDAFITAAEKMKATVNAPVNGKILDQFKGGGGAPETSIPLTPSEVIAQIAERAKAQESALAITEALNKQQLAYGQETASQEIAQQQALANQKYQIQLTALQKEAAVEGQKPAEHTKILAQIVELENAHNAQMISLATKLTEAQIKEAQRRVDEDIKSQNQSLAVSQALVDLRVKQQQYDASQAVQIKALLVADELNKEKDELNQELQLQNLSIDQRQKIADQIRDINQKLTLDLIGQAKALVEEQQKLAQESAKAWESAITPIGETMNSVIDDVLNGAHKMGAAFKKTIEDMLKAMIKSGLMGMLTGGEKGSITESIFGTKGGGANVEGGTAGALGLGGGLAGLLSGILPGGPGGIFGRLLGTAGASKDSSLQTAGVSLQSAAQMLKEAATRLGASGGAGGIASPDILGGGAPGTGDVAGPPSPTATGTPASGTAGGGVAGGISNTLSGAFVTAINGGGVVGALRFAIGSAFQGLQSLLGGVFKSVLSGIGSSLFGGVAGGVASGATSGLTQAGVTTAMTTALGPLQALGASQLGQMVLHTALHAQTLGQAIVHTAVATAHLAQSIIHTVWLALIAALNALKAVPIIGQFLAGGGFTNQMRSTPVPDGMGGQLAILHPNELVLNADQTKAFMAATPSLAAGGMILPGSIEPLRPRGLTLPAQVSQGIQRVASSTGTDAASRGDGGDSSSGDFNMHYAPIVHALDSRGVTELFKKHARELSNVVVDHLNNKGARYPKFGAG